MNNDILKDIGTELKTARINSGLSIAQVAKKLRIRTTYIKAIESGNSNLLRFDAYTLGYIKYYAEMLGLDAKSYVERMKDNHVTSLPGVASENLITGKDFLPSPGIIAICGFLLAVVYIFIEFAI